MSKPSLLNADGPAAVCFKPFLDALDSQTDLLQRKTDNIVAKMKGPAAISSFALPGATPAFDGFTLFPGATALVSRPFLAACKHFHWTWDSAAWPIPGVPAMIKPVLGTVLVSCVTVTDLKKAECPGLDSLHTWLQSKGGEKNLLKNMNHKSFRMSAQDGNILFISGGSIPLVTGTPETQTVDDPEKDKPVRDEGSDKSCVLVLPLLPGKGLWHGGSLDPHVKMDIKQYLTKFMCLTSSGTWKNLAGVIQEFAEKL